MQTAQMNSPRFNYPTAASAATNVPHTLDDFRPVHGSYAGSFSGRSSQPVWIAVGMIAVVASIAAGVNMYSESHSAKIETAVSAPNLIVPKTPVVPTAPAIAPASVEAPAAIAAPDAIRTQTANSVIAKPAAPTVTKKAAPANAVTTPQPEVVPPSPAIVEPAPTPPPIVQEPPLVPVTTPAPTPAPEVPPSQPTKL